jgi:hypothetical protein
MHCDEKFVVDYVKSTGSFALWRSSLISSLQEQGILELLRNKVLTFLKESDVLEPFEQSAKPPPDSDILYNKLLRAIQRYAIYSLIARKIEHSFLCLHVSGVLHNDQCELLDLNIQQLSVILQFKYNARM